MYFVRSTFDYCNPQGKQKDYNTELIGPIQTSLLHKIRNRLRLISALIGMWGSLPIIIFSLCLKLTYQKIINWTRWNRPKCTKSSFGLQKTIEGKVRCWKKVGKAFEPVPYKILVMTYKLVKCTENSLKCPTQRISTSSTATRVNAV